MLQLNTFLDLGSNDKAELHPELREFIMRSQENKFT